MQVYGCFVLGPALLGTTIVRWRPPMVITRSSHAAARATSLLASVAIALGLAACGQGGGQGQSSNGPKMTNIPGAVSESPAGSRNLTGHFEIRQAQPGDAFVFSGGSGGACLVTQNPADPKRCNQQSECALPSDNMGVNAASYCLPDDPGRGLVPPAGGGTCWFKPSDDFCLKPVGVGQHDTTPQDPTALAQAGMKKWRVLSCLNGAPGACRTGAPTPHEVQHQVGAVYTGP
jgi:hypothetical protein